jgi:hypothetical protein
MKKEAYQSARQPTEAVDARRNKLDREINGRIKHTIAYMPKAERLNFVRALVNSTMLQYGNVGKRLHSRLWIRVAKYLG